MERPDERRIGELRTARIEPDWAPRPAATAAPSVGGLADALLAIVLLAMLAAMGR